MVASPGRRARQGAALAPGHRLHREQVVEALWPGPCRSMPSGPRLHKAAHYARRALAAPRPAPCSCATTWCCCRPPTTWSSTWTSSVAPGGARWPTTMRRSPRSLLDAYDRGAAARRPLRAVEPSDRATSSRLLRLELLRLAERWEELLHEEPADEQAHLALIRASVAQDDVRGGAPPVRAARAGDATRARHRPEPGGRRAPRLARGRLPDGSRVPARERRRLWSAGATSATSCAVGSTRPRRAGAGCLVLSGPAGVGKSAVLEMAESRARAPRLAHWSSGDASAVEGPWPYAPVLEALSELCRQHPALLDGLDDDYRAEIERALAGRDVTWTGGSGHQRLFVAAAELIRLAAAGHGADAGRRRPAGGRRGLPAAAALPRPLRGHASRCWSSSAHRPLVGTGARRAVDSLVAPGRRHAASSCSRSSGDATRRLLADRFPDLPEPRRRRSICEVSRRYPVPGARARRAQPGQRRRRPCCPACRRGACAPSERVALLGTHVHHRRAARRVRCGRGGDLPCSWTTACPSLLVEPADLGYRFRHALVREALVDAMSPAQLGASRRDVAERARRAAGYRPARVAHQFLAAGLPATGGAVRAPGGRDGRRARRLPRRARRWSTRSGRTPGPSDLPRLLARRGDLLLALGDPEAVAAYQEAVAAHDRHRAPAGARAARPRRGVRRRPRHRAAGAGGLSLEGDAADGPILLARGTRRVLHRRRRRRLGGRPARPATCLQVVRRPVAARRPGVAAGPDRAPPRRVVRPVPHRAAAHARASSGWPPRSSTPTCASRSTCSTDRCPTPR